jgi:SAM-dependent methyltransferase
MTAIDPRHLALLRGPGSQAPLAAEAGALVERATGRRFEVTASGIPRMLPPETSEDARRQMEHYDEAFARQYSENLDYPHTQEYMAYLDRCLEKEVAPADLESVGELCCGQGEMLKLFGERVRFGVGVDVSLPMLEKAREASPGRPDYLYVQGDATRLPLADASVGSVFMLGGVHHVSDRPALFREVARVLRPGGRFFFREPVSDFFLWRAIRAVIYRLSPALDADTERPLLWDETVPVLREAGLELVSWKTYGFLGFCFFMNSDVLVFNRLFRFIPGIRALTRLAAAVDDLTTRLPGLRRSGLQVVGVARKPGGTHP